VYVFKAAVLGAGTMGAEIAQVISLSGLPVVLKDVDESQLERGMTHIREIYQRRVQRGRISDHDAGDRLALITPQVDYKGFSDVDLVIEAVPEKLSLKQAVLSEVEGQVAKTALLATNTSALPVTEVGAHLQKPQRLVGMHFFFPASVMKLVEVIAGEQTDEEYVDSAVEFVESIRRIAVRVRECPGFLVNRILMAGLAEVFRAEQDLGLEPREIDAAVAASKLAPMGPYALADALGLDIAEDVAQTLSAAYGERFDLGDRITRLIAEGKRGAKTGEGFYTYTG
jgi:3-hydroxybutyryl-CoA dehydrogenase